MTKASRIREAEDLVTAFSWPGTGFRSAVLVYSLDGRLEARLRFPEGIQSPMAVNDWGESFGVREDATIVRFHPPFLQTW